MFINALYSQCVFVCENQNTEKNVTVEIVKIFSLFFYIEHKNIPTVWKSSALLSLRIPVLLYTVSSTSYVYWHFTLNCTQKWKCIYSKLRDYRLLWVSFFCWTQNNILKNAENPQPVTSIAYREKTDLNGHSFLQNIFFVFNSRKSPTGLEEVKGE